MLNSDSAASDHGDCLACQILAGQVEVPGGTIAENPWWIADHCLGAHGLAAIVVKTRHHRENLWDLTPSEAASLGPFLQQLTQAMQVALGAERIYINSWVDQPPYHVHFVLQPRYSGKAELGLRGLELQIFRALQAKPQPEEMAAVAETLRSHLNATETLHSTPEG
ncbi:MAG: diadenosine tetraphosphate hydrolase [Leptolyngbyaceae cyanobacterium T60_A2020_046]|nr:diadenosine tetraphosphate hydrolase [Leptolyngbyaceae cyanobacterium T60_A2020_046]